MSLVEQRLRWRAEFNSGERPDINALKLYETIRCSEMERMSTQVERLCEYILYLESKIQTMCEPIFTKCATCGQDIDNWIAHATGTDGQNCQNKVALEWNKLVSQWKAEHDRK